MDNLHWTEVNGVTTVWTEAGVPLRAGLMFRTGRVDEMLITAGHTHLIEHMALTGLSDFFQYCNGYTTDAFTGFEIVGQPEDVCTFFRKVCEGLTALPADRLEVEKKILLAENARRQYDTRGNLLRWRYGEAGYGLSGEPELGIRGATIEQLQAWRMQRFTSGNAILWLSGPVPADLRLDLPPGEKWVVPQLAPIEWNFPCWFVDDYCGGVAASATVPRLTEGPIFMVVADKRMREELRNKQAVSYYPAISYDPLCADTAHLGFYADSEQSRRAELAQAFGEIFEKFTEINEDEVEAARKIYLDQWCGPLAPPQAERMVSEVQRAVIDWLLGRSYESLDQLLEEVCLINTDKVRAFGQLVRKNTMFAVPRGTIIQPWMGENSTYSSGEGVEGRKVLFLDSPIETGWLVVGHDGVSVKYTIDSHLTVRYANLAAALHFEDGGLYLIGLDSRSLKLEPTLIRNGAKVCEEIRRRIPAHLILEQGPRDPEAIPKPKTTAWQRLLASLR